MAKGPSTLWTEAPLVAIDLEGTGAQDRDEEAILEIALVPITAARPSLDNAYTTLATAPPLSQVAPELLSRLSGKVLVGHNVAVDWRLLHRRCPSIQPAGLIDTLRLSRRVQPDLRQKNLTALIERYALEDQVTRLAPSSQPHRALWDTTGAALLLVALINDLPQDKTLSFAELQHLSGLELQGRRQHADEAQQLPLL
jgi:DNA polymerase-3 subunit epsilon